MPSLSSCHALCKHKYKYASHTYWTLNTRFMTETRRAPNQHILTCSYGVRAALKSDDFRCMRSVLWLLSLECVHIHLQGIWKVVINYYYIQYWKAVLPSLIRISDYTNRKIVLGKYLHSWSAFNDQWIDFDVATKCSDRYNRKIYFGIGWEYGSKEES